MNEGYEHREEKNGSANAAIWWWRSVPREEERRTPISDDSLTCFCTSLAARSSDCENHKIEGEAGGGIRGCEGSHSVNRFAKRSSPGSTRPKKWRWEEAVKPSSCPDGDVRRGKGTGGWMIQTKRRVPFSSGPSPSIWVVYFAWTGRTRNQRAGLIVVCPTGNCMGLPLQLLREQIRTKKSTEILKKKIRNCNNQRESSFKWIRAKTKKSWDAVNEVKLWMIEGSLKGYISSDFSRI